MPYTPEQNGLIEQFFRRLKDECVWQQRLQTVEEARRIIRDWIHWYDEERSYGALGYRSPVPIARNTQPRWLDLRRALQDFGGEPAL